MTSFCSRAKGKVSAGISPTLFFSQATPFFYQLFNPWEVHVGGRVIYSRQIKVLPEPPSTFFPLPKTGTAEMTAWSRDFTVHCSQPRDKGQCPRRRWPRHWPRSSPGFRSLAWEEGLGASGVGQKACRSFLTMGEPNTGHLWTPVAQHLSQNRPDSFLNMSVR